MQHKRARAALTAGWIWVAVTMALPAPADAQGPPPSRLDPPPRVSASRLATATSS